MKKIIAFSLVTFVLVLSNFLLAFSVDSSKFIPQTKPGSLISEPEIKHCCHACPCECASCEESHDCCGTKSCQCAFEKCCDICVCEG